MAQVLLMNPAKRRKARRANPKRRAARRRNPAAVVRAAPRANPIRRHRRRRSNPIVMRRVGRVRRRRNPISLGGASIGDLIKNAAIGGGGSVAVDIIMGQVKPMLPTEMQTGTQYTLAKAAVTVGIGMLFAKMMGATGAKMAAGALTVQAANFISQQFAPSVGMPMGYFTPGMPVRNSARMGNRMIPTLKGRFDVPSNRNNQGSLGMYLQGGRGMAGAGTINEMQGTVWK